METDLNTYEIAYLLSSKLADDEVLPATDKITSLISGSNGKVQKEEKLQKRLLAYPIKKEKEAYLGVMQFQTEPEKIKDLGKELKLQPEVLRFMINRLTEKDLEAIQAQAERRARPILKPRAIKLAPSPLPPKETPKEIKPEEFERKLEEILGE